MTYILAQHLISVACILLSSQRYVQSFSPLLPEGAPLASGILKPGRLFAKLPPDDVKQEGPSNINETVNGKKKLSVRRQKTRTATADFPSFAYQRASMARNRKIRKPQGSKKTKSDELKVCFREPNGSEYTYKTNTPRVSVPDKINPNLSVFERGLNFLFGLSIGSGILSNVEAIAVQVRLLEGRSYAKQDLLNAENIDVPPSLTDISSPKRTPLEGFWISAPARLLSFGVSYMSFPFFTELIDTLVVMPPEQLDEITSKFGPGISILYGTFTSLTLSILYNRQRNIQDSVALESSLLIMILHSTLNIFKYKRSKAVEAGQCVADQIRTLVRSSRGAELMLLMYSDPYARLMELLDAEEEALYKETGSLEWKGNLFGSSRDIMKDLVKTRAKRLSDEGLALPPTHFLILNILTLLILLGYTVSAISTVDPITGVPPNESCLLFGVLSSVYVLFYNFANDLNNPFIGVYQIRRSTAAANLLEAKWLIANHPLLRGEVTFETNDTDEESGSGVIIRSPGLGDMWFERDEIYVDGDDQAKVDDLIDLPR